MVQEPDFIWLKKELVSGNTSLLLYQVPINAIKNKDNLVSNIIKMRDSVGALYIHGKEPNTDMITEEAYSPYFFKIKLDGKLTYENERELRNDFMSFSLITQYLTKKTIGVVFGRLLFFSIQRKTRFNAPIGIHYKISFRT
jgi:hypothetical protein